MTYLLQNMIYMLICFVYKHINMHSHGLNFMTHFTEINRTL